MWGRGVATIARADRHATTSPATQGAGSNYTIRASSRLTRHWPLPRWANHQDSPPSRRGGPTLVVLVSAGQANDAPVFEHLMATCASTARLGSSRTRPDRVRADKAYSSRAIRTELRRRGITTVIPEPSDQIAHRKRRGPAEGATGLDAADYKWRNVSSADSTPLSMARPGHPLRQLAITYRAAVVLRAITIWTAIISRLAAACWVCLAACQRGKPFRQPFEAAHRCAGQEIGLAFTTGFGFGGSQVASSSIEEHHDAEDNEGRAGQEE